MNTTETAIAHARSVELGPASARSVARALQCPLLEAIEAADPSVRERLELVDRSFEVWVAGWETGSRTAPWRPRSVTPWPDLVGMFAVGGAMGMAAAAGARSTPVLDSLEVTAPMMVAFLAVAFAAIAIGAVYARREREVLLMQRDDSAATTRSALLWVGAVFAAIAVIAMAVRFAIDEFFPVASLAWAMSVAALIACTVLALGAHRVARASAAGGKLRHRARGGGTAALRDEAIDASGDAREWAESVLSTLSPELRAELAEAYAAAVREAIARHVLPRDTEKRLHPRGWLAARYDVVR
ncbi:hypothetical protein [Agromyces sp. NPDC058064]|uniref:hypothetical protein n=1 Tax=Agromyces sp. NPDC058064 TaxID=3346322 RepID=UPI0036D96BFD